MNEADTCRRFVVPKLQAAGWDNELHSIAEQQEIDEYRLAMENEVITPEEPEDAERKLGDSLSSSTKRAGVRSRIVKQTAFFGYFAPKSAHDIMRKDKGLIGDLDRLPLARSAAVLGCGFEHRPGARSSNWRRDAATTRGRGRLHYVTFPMPKPVIQPTTAQSLGALLNPRATPTGKAEG